MDAGLQHRNQVDVGKAAGRRVRADAVHLVGLDVEEEQVGVLAALLERELALHVALDAHRGQHQKHPDPKRDEHHPDLAGAPEHGAHRVTDREGAGRHERGQGAQDQAAQDPERHRHQHEPAGDRQRDAERP